MLFRLEQFVQLNPNTELTADVQDGISEGNNLQDILDDAMATEGESADCQPDE